MRKKYEGETIGIIKIQTKMVFVAKRKISPMPGRNGGFHYEMNSH